MDFDIFDICQQEGERNQPDSDFAEFDWFEFDKENEKIARRQKRLEMCRMSYNVTFDGHTGKPKASIMRCGLPECEFCNANRASNLKRQIEKAITEGETVYMVENPTEDELSEIKNAGKDTYRSMPSETGLVVFTTIQVGTYVDGESLDDLQWTEYTKTPQGSRMSGKLGKTVASEVDVEIVRITRAVISVETEDVKLLNKLTNEVVSETSELDPKTEEQVEEALNERSQLLCKKLSEHKVDFDVVYRKFNLEINRINWLDTNYFLTKRSEKQLLQAELL